ncbi:MAG: beta-propeller fold lactonase family protein [Bacilli bacterium]|nr:beta-propeller fold lactonase family protein [Bacilli bacterium]
MKPIHGFIGTYADKGIYEFIFDLESGKFIHNDLYIQVKEAKYLSYEKGILASLCNVKQPGILINGKSLQYSNALEKHVACYITQDEAYIYTANYHDGNLVRYHKGTHGICVDKVVEIQEKAGSHQVLLLQEEILVPNCLLDNIYVYDKTTLSFKQKIEFPKGSGPRHGVITHDEKTLYIVSEYSCELYAIALDQHYRIVKHISLLKEGEHGAAAAIRMSNDEQYIYVSIREINTLYVIDVLSMSIIQVLACEGKHPRDINLSIGDEYLFCANKDTDDVTAFQRNKTTGHLTLSDRLSNIPQGVSIVFDEGGLQDD